MTIARQPPSSLMTLGVFAQRPNYVVHNIVGGMGEKPQHECARGTVHDAGGLS